jgi:hypothetical protein
LRRSHAVDPCRVAAKLAARVAESAPGQQGPLVPLHPGWWQRLRCRSTGIPRPNPPPRLRPLSPSCSRIEVSNLPLHLWGEGARLPLTDLGLEVGGWMAASASGGPSGLPGPPCLEAALGSPPWLPPRHRPAGGLLSDCPGPHDDPEGRLAREGRLVDRAGGPGAGRPPSPRAICVWRRPSQLLNELSRLAGQKAAELVRRRRAEEGKSGG